jgi:hypothetical protein
VTAPYYQDSLVTLYHGDCLDILPELSAGSVDIVLTDPPFFMPATHYSSRTQWPKSFGDTSILGTFWRAVLDVTIPTMSERGHFVAFCDGASYPVFYPEVYRRFDAVKSLVWDKGRIGMGSPWRNQHELMIAGRWSGSSRTASRGCPDVLRHAPVSAGARVHPVDKPIGLLSEILRPIAEPGAVVLDPFAGGGSTLLAARDSGFRSVGVETEERYCEAIAKRLSADVLDFGGAA